MIARLAAAALLAVLLVPAGPSYADEPATLPAECVGEELPCPPPVPAECVGECPRAALPSCVQADRKAQRIDALRDRLDRKNARIQRLRDRLRT